MNDPNYNDPNYNYTNEPDSDFDSDLDCDFEELDEHIYHDPTPFKSYDEILAARRRTKTARRGAMVGCLVVVLLLIGGTALGVFGGNFILNRAMNAMAEANRQEKEEAETPPETESGQNGLQLQSADENARPMITTYDVSDLAEQASRSVVGIVTESYSSFSSGSTGTGIIMDSRGYIITNNHVIDGGDNITVVLSDGTNYPAYLIGADAQTDIAVLKVETQNALPAATFGSSDDLRLGEPAIVIGNPGGLDLQGTVTAGIISATERRITIDNNIMTLIQTDASINPGNSGGPLLNKYGQVVGVTSNKISADGFEGLGFAIPMTTVKPIVEELIENGYVSGRPLVAVSVRTVSQMAAAFYNLPQGLMVDLVASDSNAAAAGLQQSDIITHMNGQRITSVSAACTVRNRFKAGEEITLSVYRGGRTVELTFALNEQQSASTGWDF
ncbi:MAG: trypsin-like peptidase domain-containing protein [Clostridia bacterium]|nr:trypsin-like peptidase domain-containing protein [Clostridia bacterium]